MSVFKNDLKDITEDEIRLHKKFFRGYDYRGAGYTFIAHYIWLDTYCVSWEIIDGYLCLSGTRCGSKDGEPYMIMPLIMTPEDAASCKAEGGAQDKDATMYRSAYEPESLRRVILECERRFRDVGAELDFSGVPGHMRDILKAAFPGDGEIEFYHGEDYDEYVYLKEKLIDLSGRALHKKKNHLNFFLRTYEYEAKPIREVDPKDILALSAEIRDYKAQDEDEEEDIENEYKAIERMLELLDYSKANQYPCGRGEGECPIYGVGIYIKGKLEAFAIGELISHDMAAEHFEKANDSYRGLYQLVCREFCKELPENIIYVNREEDMGIPGLRQAKEALKPDHMEERYYADIKI